ncbi:MAG: PAS domain-containing protein, partial [Desulfobacterales bacterium]
MAKKPIYEELEKKINYLELNEASFRSLLHALPVGIGVVCDRVVMEVNERLCDMLGYSPEEILGKSARMFYPTDEDFEYVGIKKY